MARLTRGHDSAVVNGQLSGEQLVALAIEVSNNAVAPHSRFHVGAALESEDGTIYTGCNVESDSYGLTICAERVALTKALSEGARSFNRIAIIGIQHDQNGNSIVEGEYDEAQGLGPCGACRQLLWDHCRDIEVLGGTPSGEVGRVWRLADLLPDAFQIER
tara:strand:- start:1550 stop:2032 length:483 start_codon:yes stop_codon:yes gene_type:complete